MNPQQQQSNAIYLTDFSGQSENPSIGSGVAVGLDLFTTKTVARLSRKMNQVDGNIITGFPKWITAAFDGATPYLFVQDTNGQIYRSTDIGLTWAVFPGNSGNPGRGIIAWQDVLFSFTDTDIDVYSFTTATWTNSWWIGTLGQTALVSSVNHFPFSSPSNTQALYFCNNSNICLIQWFTPTGAAFDPLNPATYFIQPQALILPNNNTAIVLGYLPTDNIAIGWTNTTDSSHVEVGIWDGFDQTILSNIVSLPGASNPVTQMLTKNGVLYCVTDKEHGIYVVNGSSAQLIDRLYLRMSNRFIGGAQVTTRLASTIYQQGADFLGPELLTGGSNLPVPNGVTEIAGTGLYPWGVWSVNIETNQYGQTIDTGSTGVIGLRFPLSFGVINANYTTNYSIGFVKVMPDNSVIVGWQNGASYGIDRLDAQNYISNATTTFLESSLYLAGTRLTPRTFNTFEFNLIAPLTATQQVQFFWRTTTAMDYQPFPNNLGVFTAANMTDANGVNLSGTIQQLPFQNVEYIQIAAQINAGSSENLTPQLRDIILK